MGKHCCSGKYIFPWAKHLTCSLWADVCVCACEKRGMFIYFATCGNVGRWFTLFQTTPVRYVPKMHRVSASDCMYFQTNHYIQTSELFSIQTSGFPLIKLCYRFNLPPTHRFQHLQKCFTSSTFCFSLFSRPFTFSFCLRLSWVSKPCISITIAHIGLGGFLNPEPVVINPDA